MTSGSISRSRTIGAGRALAALLAAFALPAPTANAGAEGARFPSPRGHLSDFAQVVDRTHADSIEAFARRLRERTGVEMAVVTLPDLGGEEIEPVAVALFEKWGIGRSGQDEGVLLLLAPRERRVRIEVGYGLEGTLPDGRVGAIIREEMASDLSAGRFGLGLWNATQAIGAAVLAERSVAASGEQARASPHRRRPSPVARLFFLAVALALLYLVLTRGYRRPRRLGDWRAGRHREPDDGWGGFWGGFGGFGGFGGGGFGGGAGGGFGGFGGGRSGGGGASGRF